VEAAPAAAGQLRIEWADGHMPVLRSIRDRFGRERPLAGVRVAACLHVTAETANLMRALAAGGAEVALCSANPFSVQDDVAAALGSEHGVEVLGRRGDGPEEISGHVEALAGREPQVTLDDGADLVGLIHAQRPEHAAAMLGATEETTTGLVRLRALAAAGTLRCPVLAVNEARTERVFNDYYGTGQSALDGILRATNLLLAGRTMVVLGYGYTGRGVARRAAGLGASVVVCEIDPLRALEARMDGFGVMPALAAAERGDIFVTVTGGRGALGREHFERMSDGAVLANAGHFDVEIDLAALRALAETDPVEVRPLIERYDLGGKALHVLAGGRVVNLAAAEGHPPDVMDMSFATQALAVETLARAGGSLGPGVHPVPAEVDREVARLKLASLAIEIDSLSEEQAAYLRPFDHLP
jgi:adenosylhomocysteinase